MLQLPGHLPAQQPARLRAQLPVLVRAQQPPKLQQPARPLAQPLVQPARWLGGLWSKSVQRCRSSCALQRVSHGCLRRLDSCCQYRRHLRAGCFCHHRRHRLQGCLGRTPTQPDTPPPAHLLLHAHEGITGPATPPVASPVTPPMGSSMPPPPRTPQRTRSLGSAPWRKSRSLRVCNVCGERAYISKARCGNPSCSLFMMR